MDNNKICSICGRTFPFESEDDVCQSCRRRVNEYKESRAETLIRGFAALNRGDLNKAEEYLEQSKDK